MNASGQACAPMLHRARWAWVVLSLALLLSLIPAVQAGGVSVTRAVTELRENALWLDADAQLELFKDQQDALQSGVALVFAWDVVIEQDRGWWGTREASTNAWRARIEYHALSQLYRVLWSSSAGESLEPESYTSLAAAVDNVSHPRELWLAPASAIPMPGTYRGRARLRLVHDSLPLPIRPRAFFASHWQLSSEWYLWAF
ncbi:MAG TPA: DUF4390 domain-containing protein [bacterium]|nr:DUF4390 domain-containing protein [bacterium]